MTSQSAENRYQSLEKYATDLTELAAAGKLDPVIGRDLEVRRVMQILNRRTKNNPVIIGEAGVGKTAIVEGLAQRIAEKTCPTTSWASACSRSTWARWSPARSSGASSKSASRPSWKK